MNNPNHWLEITRDKQGFATEQAKQRMYNSLPIVVCTTVTNEDKLFQWCAYNYIDKECWLDFVGEIERETAYKCYTPVPKINTNRRTNSNSAVNNKGIQCPPKTLPPRVCLNTSGSLLSLLYPSFQ